MSALQPATTNRYAAALRDFSSELEEMGTGVYELTEEELDWFLAERVVDLFEESGGLEGLGAASTLLAAFAKANPRHHYRTAWKALDVWRTRRPPLQAPALPAVLAFAIANWLVMAGECSCAAAVLLCFTGLLRASETLSLDGNTFIRTASGFVALLGRTKRGAEQKVLFEEPSTVAWLEHYILRYPVEPGDKICPVSYPRLQRWLQKAADALGFGAVHWTSHGLRRGGATELLSRGVPLSDIMLFGRWLSDRSAREYLRRGEVSLTRLRVDIATEAWSLAFGYCKLGSHVWAVV